MTEPSTEVTVHSRSERHVWADVRQAQDRLTDGVTAFAGSLAFVNLHVAWFVIWVSLEAIFLSTFVMISQNRQAARADVRSELDFETNLRPEVWSVHIGRTLGLDPAAVEAHVQRLVTGVRTGLLEGTARDVDPAAI